HGVHHMVQRRIEELLGSLGVETPDEFRRVLEIGKEDSHLLALTCQGGADGEDLFGQVWGRVGQRDTVRGVRWWRRGRGCIAGITSPDQACAVLIDGEALALDELALQIVQGSVVELELPLERAVGKAPTPLQHGYRLVEDLLKGH